MPPSTRIGREVKVAIETKKLHDLAAIRFHPDCVAAVRAGAEALGYAHRDIISGAGHDAVHLSKVTPTAMIFVPCKDGLSHNEAESATARALRRRRPGAARGGPGARREARRDRLTRSSSRCLSPGSIDPRAPKQTEGWIPVTSTGMT